MSWPTSHRRRRLLTDLAKSASRRGGWPVKRSPYEDARKPPQRQDAIRVRIRRMSGRPSRLRALQRLCTALGLLCLAWYGVVEGQSIHYQQRESAGLQRALVSHTTEHPTIERPRRAVRPSATRSDHQLIGRLEIPRLNISDMVVDGDDLATLKRAAGHLTVTPLPWEFGNSAVVAHRDSFFRRLEDIKLSDRLTLTTPHGTFRYD